MAKQALFSLVAGLLLAAISAPLSAQLIEQIGNELTAPSATSSTPLYRSASTSSFDYSVQQTLYPASSISIPPGSSISTIRYYKTDTFGSTAADNTLEVWLRETTATNYTASDTFGNAIQGATQVFTTTTFQMPATAGWVEFGPFTTPYTYTGSNLEIVVSWDCSTSPTPTTGGFSWSYESYSGTTTDSLGRGYSSSSAQTTGTTLNTSTNQGHVRYPVIQIEYTVAGNGVILQNNTAPQDLLTGAQTDVVLMDLNAVSFGANQTLNSISFVKSGSLPDTDIGTIKLVDDLNDNGVVDGTDTILGQGTLTGSSITFNSAPGFPVSVPTSGGPRLLLAVTSANPWSANQTLEFSIPTSGSVTWSGGTDFTSYPVSSGTWNIVPPQVTLGVQGTGNSFPFNYSSLSGRFQSARAAADLNIPAGSLITEVRVYGSSVTPPTFTNLQLRMGYTNLPLNALTSNFDQNYFGSLTTVIQGDVTPTQSGGTWYHFPLSTPFPYNGVDDLLMDWSYDNRSGTGWTISTSVPPAPEVTSSRVYSNGGGATTTTGTAATTGGNFGLTVFYDPNPGSYQYIGNQASAPLLWNDTPQTNRVMLDLVATSPVASQDISQITVTKNGTVPDTDITGVQLVRDDNDNGEIDGTDTVLGTAAGLTGGSVAFSFTPALTVTTTTPVRMLFAFSTTSALTAGDTIGFELSSSSSVTWSGGNDITGYPLASQLVTVTVPQLNFGIATPATNTIPFGGTGTTSTVYRRYLHVYSAAELSSLPAGTLINEIRIHAQNSTSLTPPPVYNDFELRLAHSDTDPNNMSSTWEDNWVGSQTTVISGTTYSPTAGTATFAPDMWVFQFTTPFVYNGAQGIAIEYHMTGRTGNFGVATGGGRQRLYTTSTLNPPTGTLTTSGNFGLDILWDANPNGVAVVNQASPSLSQNQTDYVMLDLAAFSFGTSRTFSGITLNKVAGSTVADNEISLIELVLDGNDDGVVDPTDSVLASGTLSGGAITLTLTSPMTISSQTRFLVAITNTNPLAYGATFGLEIASASDVGWSGSPADYSTYPISSGLATVRLAGTITISQTGPADFTDIGDAFDALELTGVGGPVVLEIQDSATYMSTPAYTLGMDDTQPVPLLTPVPGSSATNTITLRPAPGQTPVIMGNTNGAILFGNSTTSALQGRGGLVINQNYVTVEGLRVTGGPNFGIMVQGNNSYGVNYTDITIRRCIVHDIPDGPGIAHMGQNSGYADNFIVENNFVWNCMTNSVPPTSHLLTLTYGSITIRNAANGSGSVRHNTVIHTSPFTNTGGIFAFSSSTTYPLNDINNNIIICTDPLVPAFYSSSATSLPTVANCNFNVWFANTQSNQASVATFNDWQLSGRDAAGFNTDPGLVNHLGPNFDLHLLPTSPCIDPVGQTSTVADDIDGEVRLVPDIGADEYLPGIEVAQGTTLVRSGGSFNMGVLPAPAAATPVTFTISNSDVVTHNLTGTPIVAITLGSNLDPATVVQSQPTTTTITPTTTTDFTVLVDPTGPGAFDLTLSIANSTPGKNPYVFTVFGTVNTPPTLSVNTTAGAVAPNGTINVPFNSDVSAIGLDITVSDPEAQPVFVNTVITNVTTQGFNIPGEWESGAVAVPYDLSPTTGQFTVPNVTHQVTVTADDGNLTANFVFNISVGANTAPTIALTSNSTPVSNMGTINATYADPLTSLGLVISIDDVDNNDTALTVSFNPTEPGSFNVATDWETSQIAPYTVQPSVGSFDVSGETYTVTLTADDGLLTTNFTFTIVVSTANPPTLEIPGSGSSFTGSTLAGFTATVLPGPLPTDMVLQLDDIEFDNIDIIAVNVSPSAPAGILAPAPSVGNPNGSIITFTDDAPLNAGSAVPGTYTWTFELDDGLAPTTTLVDVSITVVDVPATHTIGVNANVGGDGSAADPYAATASLAGAGTLEMAVFTDANIPNTLTEVSVVGDPANPSTLFAVAFFGTGNAGVVEATPMRAVTVADVGEHTYTVTVTDGGNTVDAVVRITVDGTGNVQPGASRAGGAFSGDVANGFTLSVNPGDTLTNATITVTDTDAGDQVEVVSVSASPSPMAGVTAPTAAAPAAQAVLDWTGTAEADGTPGSYVYTVTVTDNITTPVTFTVTITLVDTPPEFVNGADVIEGDGSAALPLLARTETGKGRSMHMASFSDQNTSQSLSIVTTAPDAGNPANGVGFVVSLTDGELYVSPTAALTSRDVGVWRFAVTVTDGANNVTVNLEIRVTTAAAEEAESSSCTSSSQPGWPLALALFAGLGAAVVLRRRVTA